MPPVRRQTSRHAAPLRRAMTDAERALWLAVRDRRLAGHKFRRPVTIGPYIADFVCLERSLIVEADGGQHSEDDDAARTSYLKSQGFRLIRFWNNDVLRNLEGVLEVLLIALEERKK